MQSEMVLDILRGGLKVAVMISAPLLLFGLVAGVLINVFQAVTQITESTLAIVPKMIAIVIALVLFSPWILDVMSDFTIELFENIPNLVR